MTRKALRGVNRDHGTGLDNLKNDAAIVRKLTRELLRSFALSLGQRLFRDRSSHESRERIAHIKNPENNSLLRTVVSRES